MNCIKVQEAIWCGELDADMLAHIATCPDCKREHRNVQELSSSLDDINIPMQSRSLLPSRREIEQSLVVRKRMRWTKWGISSVAGAACVVMAIVALPNFLAPAPNSANLSSSNSQVAASPSAVHPGNSQTGNGGNNTVPSDTTQLGQKTQTSTTDSNVNADQQLVTVDPGADRQFQEELDSIRAYLSKGSDPNIFKHITVKNFVEDLANSDSNEISGTVTLTIENQPGQSSPYGTGDQPFDVTRFAHFTKQQGLWTLDNLSTSPYFRQNDGANNGGGWQTVDTKLYTIQLPAYLGVNVGQDGSITITNQGKVMGTLDIEGQLKHNPGDYYSAVMLPNHSQVISKQMVNVPTPTMHVVMYDLKLSPPAADPTAPQTEVQHTYFISDTNKELVFDLTMPNTFNLDTYQKICSSFQTK